MKPEPDSQKPERGSDRVADPPGSGSTPPNCSYLPDSTAGGSPETAADRPVPPIPGVRGEDPRSTAETVETPTVRRGSPGGSRPLPVAPEHMSRMELIREVERLREALEEERIANRVKAERNLRLGAENARLRSDLTERTRELNEAIGCYREKPA